MFQIRFRRLDVREHALEEELRRPVGIERSRRAAFVQRHFFRHAVNRRRGREHDVAAAVFFHQREQIERSRHVVVVIEQRLGDGFADGLQPGEMNHRVEMRFFENLFERREVEQVDLVELRRFSRELRAALHGFFLRIVEVVDDGDVIACLKQFDDRMRADVAGAACDEDFHRMMMLLIQGLNE